MTHKGLPLQHMRNNPQQWANNTKHVKASPMSKAYKGPLILRKAYKIVAFCHGFGLLCLWGNAYIPKGQKEGFVVGETHFSRHLSSISLLLFGSTKIICWFFFFFFIRQEVRRIYDILKWVKLMYSTTSQVHQILQLNSNILLF